MAETQSKRRGRRRKKRTSNKFGFCMFLVCVAVVSFFVSKSYFSNHNTEEASNVKTETSCVGNTTSFAILDNFQNKFKINEQKYESIQYL